MDGPKPFRPSEAQGPHKYKKSWFPDLQYADDRSIMSHSTASLQETISQLAELYTRFGLEFNVRKTEVLNWTGKNSEATASEIPFNGTPFQVVSSFKYLGAYIVDDCKQEKLLDLSGIARSGTSVCLGLKKQHLVAPH